MINIREIRLKLNLSQEQFAELLGVDPRSVSRWENGHHKPSPMAQKLMDMITKS